MGKIFKVPINQRRFCERASEREMFKLIQRERKKVGKRERERE